MTLNDTLSNAMSQMLNSERVGKSACEVPDSKVIRGVLNIMKKNNYIENFEAKKYGNKSKITVTLNGTINKCNSIKPRFSVKNGSFEKFEQRYLPAYDMGVIIVSTIKGIITHHEAKKMGLGGRLLAYVY